MSSYAYRVKRYVIEEYYVEITTDGKRPTRDGILGRTVNPYRITVTREVVSTEPTGTKAGDEE